MAKADMEVEVRVADEWISVKDRRPPTDEPVVYCKPNPRKKGNWHVGIAYWTVSEQWKPREESTTNPEGFTHWLPLPPAPKAGA